MEAKTLASYAYLITRALRKYWNTLECKVKVAEYLVSNLLQNFRCFIIVVLEGGGTRHVFLIQMQLGALCMLWFAIWHFPCS